MTAARSWLRTGAAWLAAIVTISAAGCAHAPRVSRRTVGRLTNSGAPFVLVFGSLATPSGRPAHPEIRFVYQRDRTHPEYLLASVHVAADERFYAILQVPKDAAQELRYLDQFYIAVGSAATGFDRVLYVHLQRPKAPVAMYVGEMRIVPARNRTAGGEKVALSVSDDFRDAARELKRLYPRFEGTFDDEARHLPRAAPAK